MTAALHTWVEHRLGIRINPAETGPDARHLIGLALRRNPRRAQLLVSRVLGKHIPTDPRLVRAAGLLLGGLVKNRLSASQAGPTALPTRSIEFLTAALQGDSNATEALYTQGAAEASASSAGSATKALVLGYAETATALGHCVADALGADYYLHSTRRPHPALRAVGGFQETHSHAPEHLLLPTDRRIFHGDQPLVLVDDELSTGTTVLNTITELHRIAPRERYLVATLLDVRTEPGRLPEAVAALGAHLEVVALSAATLELPADVTERANEIRTQLIRPHQLIAPPALHRSRQQRLTLRSLGWHADLPTGARHGWTHNDRALLETTLPALANNLARQLPERRIHVLGTEELMALPLRIAEYLRSATGAAVTYSTTTRSPALVVPEPGYAITSGLQFPAHDRPADGPGPRFAYNLGSPTDPPWEAVVLVVDTEADTAELHAPDGLLSQLGTRAERILTVVAP